ncbi:hypothetical protein K457DRAFT_131315 [Linnemannia elongata AG-77]|uniref:Uncharacterized protein n=1 Tax=Linnemannia elongata AG-77 TaxID=1314771 RepID=A0A197JBJ2_9FUNG|nr:hypothetical protein K457DRAFT_131315 [Linnemannia elongata AG-77]
MAGSASVSVTTVTASWARIPCLSSNTSSTFPPPIPCSLLLLCILAYIANLPLSFFDCNLVTFAAGVKDDISETPRLPQGEQRQEVNAKSGPPANITPMPCHYHQATAFIAR